MDPKRTTEPVKAVEAARTLEPLRTVETPRTMEKYGIDEMMNLYGMDSWGSGYFRINDEGHLLVTLSQDESRAVDVYREVRALAKKGLTTPIVLRFPQLLESQVNNLSLIHISEPTRH